MISERIHWKDRSMYYHNNPKLDHYW